MERVLKSAQPGSVYNIGGNNEWINIDIVNLVCDLLDERLGRRAGENRKLITFVKDRPGHDRRYAIDASRLKHDLGWEPSYTFERGIAEYHRLVSGQPGVGSRGYLRRVSRILFPAVWRTLMILVVGANGMLGQGSAGPVG